ncbi:acetylxylan esterase [Methylococcus sp. Mc7]|uniref:acetylxylan esterase n=1 Tax=Methylococcus sp. Mc7 TaxID=2860258 RepID=UPI001C528675|nr:acetylxylan esterase [Methylococcus sp. Mc7]QXP83283.1 acetylxylan esterase [Methylococcus sp. Mc7]
MPFSHSYPFDPAYGFSLDQLLRVEPPDPPEDFAAFWSARYDEARNVAPRPELRRCGWSHPRFQAFDLTYRSTGAITIGGWALVPAHGRIRRGFVVGHGYGGRDGPDLDLPFDDAVVLFPCFRGLSRSRCADIPETPDRHVLCGIEDRDRYVLGGCVEDLWLAVSTLLDLFPEVEGRVGYLGISFGGGIGALSLPWEPRLQRAHLNVPTFGHQPLRLTLPTVGSGESVRRYRSSHGNVTATLAYYDAAIAARFTGIPVHVAAALFDPAVAPPGQFAVFNALAGPNELFVLDAGHFDYPRKPEQDRSLSAAIAAFFEPL